LDVLEPGVVNFRNKTQEFGSSHWGDEDTVGEERWQVHGFLG